MAIRRGTRIGTRTPAGAPFEQGCHPQLGTAWLVPNRNEAARS
jgi:hypothetical protein